MRFFVPGALHHARWMAKALYSFMTWMFRAQSKLTVHEERGLRDICIFLVRVYIRAWFTAPLAISSPNNDLAFFQLLVQCAEENKSLTKVVCNEFAGHLWYLSEELKGLAFFDSAVSMESKC